MTCYPILTNYLGSVYPLFIRLSLFNLHLFFMLYLNYFFPPAKNQTYSMIPNGIRYYVVVLLDPNPLLCYESLSYKQWVGYMCTFF